MHYGYDAKQECNEFFLIIGSSANSCEIYLKSLETLNYRLLEIVGIGYVIEHYIAFFKKEQHEKAYKCYVTDALRIITENTAKANGGRYIQARYAELIEPMKEETRTANEVIIDLKEKLRRL